MIMDVFSRKIVGWEVHAQESGFNAGILVHKAILSEGCTVSPPVLHLFWSSSKMVFVSIKNMLADVIDS
jgi:transposase InsO family protein